MSRRSSHKKGFIPRSYRRREIIIDYFNSLGGDISELGTEIVSSELNIHDFENLVNSIFFQKRSRLPYIDCVKTLEVTLCNNFKNTKKFSDHESLLIA